MNDEDRLDEIHEAMMRYVVASVLIPDEWMEEFRAIIERHRARQAAALRGSKT